jgi:hypothetical protein
LSSEKILINPPKTLNPKQNPISHLLYNNKTEETSPFFLSVKPKTQQEELRTC